MIKCASLNSGSGAGIHKSVWPGAFEAFIFNDYNPVKEILNGKDL
jgi:hypothetical protein